MVEIEKIRAEFSKRLHEACSIAGVRERGRAVDIKSELKRRGVDTSTTAIGKWLNGDSIPEKDKLLPLSDWLGVRPEWLEYGRGLPLPSLGFEVSETASHYSLVEGMKAGAALGAVAGMAMAAASPRAGSNDIDQVEQLPMPLTLCVRHAKKALGQSKRKGAEEFAQSIVGVQRCPREAVELIDAILEALALEELDPEEIMALTTLVKKRRNEKVHGITSTRSEGMRDNELK
ncbi:hypothetical protein [Pseudomonas sp. AE27]|uniref:hypothetical protein n=1 Tax=Pseudomonas sp. AE27 TaxID=3127460 RepID=UPI0030D0754D